jgi:hypothetical protein
VKSSPIFLSNCPEIKIWLVFGAGGVLLSKHERRRDFSRYLLGLVRLGSSSPRTVVGWENASIVT